MTILYTRIVVRSKTNISNTHWRSVRFVASIPTSTDSHTSYMHLISMHATVAHRSYTFDSDLHGTHLTHLTAQLCMYNLYTFVRHIYLVCCVG